MKHGEWLALAAVLVGWAAFVWLVLVFQPPWFIHVFAPAIWQSR